MSTAVESRYLDSETIPDPSFRPWGDWTLNNLRTVIISPTLASEILENCNGANRRLRPGHAENLAAAMREGRWNDGIVDPITFDTFGRLMSGQHRLSAVVLSGIARTFLVKLGTAPEAYAYIDRGIPHTAADVLHNAGETDSQNLAAVAAIVAHWSSGTRSADLLRGVGDANRLLAVVRDNPDLRDAVPVMNRVRRVVPAMPRVVSFVAFMTRRVDLAQSEQFFAAIETGANLSPGDPILALRNRFLASRELPRGTRRADPAAGFEQLHAMVKTWNLVRAGARVSKIQLPYREHGERRILDHCPEFV